MATDAIGSGQQVSLDDVRGRGLAFGAVIESILLPFASLKLTVVLFFAAVLLIFIGTTAQYYIDMWEVMDRIFRVWVAWIEVRFLFPRSFFPTWPESLPDLRVSRSAFPFPGGALIGLLMVVNLLSAHLIRFRIQAKGSRLAAGLILLLIGFAITWLVIVSGHNYSGLQDESPFRQWTSLWILIRAGVSALALVFTYLFLSNWRKESTTRYQRWVEGSISAALLVTAVLLWARGTQLYLGDAGMRILWQLIKASVAAYVLLIACKLLFKKRAGVVLLHGGVALMMFGQFYVANYDVEEQMSLIEGQSVNYAHDIRAVELAVIDRDNPDHPDQDVVVVVPLIRNNSATEFSTSSQIQDERLPFDIKVVELLYNSTVQPLGSGETAKATVGRGKAFRAEPARAASGASGGEINRASVYVRLTKRDGVELGTYLLSQDWYQDPRTRRFVGFDRESVEVDGRTYELELRFERNYKDYRVTLLDVAKDDYMGTSTPRNYSSDVQLVDESRNTDRKILIWMNNPLRYAGETFYQSGYNPGPPESTTLQVVRNSGWMIPYVACMIVWFGMGSHFVVGLRRFLDRREREGSSKAASAVAYPGLRQLLWSSPSSTSPPTDDKQEATKRKRRKRESPQLARQTWSTAAWSVRLGATLPWCVVLLAFFVLWSAARPSAHEEGTMNLNAFGELPVIFKGRVKPYDSLARNALLVISGRQSFRARYDSKELAENWSEIKPKLQSRWGSLTDERLKQFEGDSDALAEFVVEHTDSDPYTVEKYLDRLVSYRQPAVRWLLDVIAGTEAAERHRVFRIDSLDVLDTLGLKRRKGFRYALNEFRSQLGEFNRQVDEARRLRQENPEQLSFYQRKLLEVDGKFRTLTLLHAAFQPPPLPPLPNAAERENDPQAADSKVQQFIQQLTRRFDVLRSMEPPLSVPAADGKADWEPYATAWTTAYLQRQFLQKDADPAIASLSAIMVAYASGDVSTFNHEVAQFQAFLASDPPVQLQSKSTLMGGLIDKRFGTFYHFESYFNHFAPLFWSKWMYVIAFVLCALAWLGWSQPLNRAALWLVILILIVHSCALVARIYIAGRPPVTNLYSSAVFIGWGCAILAVVMEFVFRNGIGTVVASIIGFATLQIADGLALEGDTIGVLQAVLDTNFWLATHVVCITLGYSTTFLAGGLAMLYILLGLLTPTLRIAVNAVVSRGRLHKVFCFFMPTIGPDARKDLTRMIYGTICFATFLSFIGTVLGGLWADDSWGRFWGWDPKENGALMIVLWNALVLHARWGSMVKDRGLAMLAVFGNVVTAWSWFGVNELNVGLHSYGFTEGALFRLAMFVASQIGLILLGGLLVLLWNTFKLQDAETPTASP